jgi:hypothetical protein
LVDVACDDRRRPVHGGRQVDSARCLQLPVPRERNGSERGCGRTKEPARCAIYPPAGGHSAVFGGRRER